MKRILVLLICILACNPLYAYQSEDKLKAVIIGKLAKFITWQTDNSDEFVITVLNNPFDDLLDRLYKNKQIKKKPVKIRYINDITELSATHVLYIPHVSQRELDTILDNIKGKNIVTISDIRGFSQKKGMIQIYFVSQKVKLKINHDVSKNEDLKISSTLLRIATIVKNEAE